LRKLERAAILMQMNQLISPALLMVLLGFVGCSKKELPQAAPLEVQGIKVDVPKLQTAFANGDVEQKAAMAEVVSHLRYGQHVKALAILDKLSRNPNLSEPQKQAVNEVIQQVTQVIKAAPPA
jgi:hypothetical protein